MADVDAGVDRGQILIVTGLLLAVVFVGLALVMNSAIYAENVATRDTGSDTREALEQRQMLEEHLAQSVDRVNTQVETTNNETLEAELQQAITNQSDTHALTEASRGKSANVQVANTSEGTRLRQTNASRNFTSVQGATNWTLSNDVPEGGQFTMNIQNDSLFVSTWDTTMALMAESAFAIEFPTASGTWRIYVFSGAATDSVYAVVETDDQDFQAEGLQDRTNPDHVVDGWLNQSCSMQGETVSLRLGEQQFGGTHCEEFSFYEELDAHEVRFNNTKTDDTDRAMGTYDILIGTTEYNENGFEPVGSGDQPFYQSALYSFNYSYTYETSTTVYEAPNRTVKPKNKDPGGILWQHPRIVELTVDNKSDATSAEFDANWTVEDVNGELERVEVELIERSVEQTESEAQSDVESALEDDAYDEFLDDEYGLGLLDPVTDIISEYMNDYDSVIGFPINTNQVVDNETVAVSGTDANGSTTVSDSNLGTDYYVEVTVVDTSGRSATAVRACDESGCEEVE